MPPKIEKKMPSETMKRSSWKFLNEAINPSSWLYSLYSTPVPTGTQSTVIQNSDALKINSTSSALHICVFSKWEAYVRTNWVTDWALKENECNNPRVLLLHYPSILSIKHIPAMSANFLSSPDAQLLFNTTAVQVDLA